MDNNRDRPPEEMSREALLVVLFWIALTGFVAAFVSGSC